MNTEVIYKVFFVYGLMIGCGFGINMPRDVPNNDR